MIQPWTSSKCGFYKRTDVVYQRRVVKIRGLTLIPCGPPGRKWAGLVWITSQNKPIPTSGHFVRHDLDGQTYELDYNLEDQESEAPLSDQKDKNERLIAALIYAITTLNDLIGDQNLSVQKRQKLEYLRDHLGAAIREATK